MLSRKSVSTDPSKPLAVPVGMDSLSQIGKLLLLSHRLLLHGLHLLLSRSNQSEESVYLESKLG